MTSHGTTSVAAAPAVARTRLLAPDLARGTMLLLIALAHAPLYLASTAPPSMLDQVVDGGHDLLVLSRSYPLFAVFFGYGLVWLVGRRRREGATAEEARTTVRRRGRWLLLLGLAMALLVTPIEILGAYGLTAVLAAGAVVASDAGLRRVIRVLLPISVVLVVVGAYGMTTGAPEGGFSFGDYPGYDIEGLLTRLVMWLVSVVTNLLFFPIVLVTLIGVWAGRRRLLEDAAEHRPLLRRVAVVGIATGVVGGIPYLLLGTGTLGGDAAGWATALHTLTGVPAGLGYAACFGLLGARLRHEPRLLAPVRATGQRSLTSYVVMEAGLAVLLSSTFVGLAATTGAAGGAVVALVAWLVAVLLASVLAATGRSGPLERLLRRMVDRSSRRPAPVDADRGTR